jgi:hypothetical protein
VAVTAEGLLEQNDLHRPRPPDEVAAPLRAQDPAGPAGKQRTDGASSAC